MNNIYVARSLGFSFLFVVLFRFLLISSRFLPFIFALLLYLLTYCVYFMAFYVLLITCNLHRRSRSKQHCIRGFSEKTDLCARTKTAHEELAAMRMHSLILCARIKWGKMRQELLQSLCTRTKNTMPTHKILVPTQRPKHLHASPQACAQILCTRTLRRNGGFLSVSLCAHILSHARAQLSGKCKFL